MATATQRVKAIADALVNGTATTLQITRLGLAHAMQHGQIEAYNAATAAEKATMLIGWLRQQQMQLVRGHDVALIQRQAEQDAAAARSAVDEEFSDTP